MQDSDAPVGFPIPFGNAAVGPYINPIPVPSQIAITPGRASLTTGFVPLNFDPVDSGGIPPFGGDMNGLLYQITANVRFYVNAGGPLYYDAGYSASIGGYPNGAVLASAITAGVWWQSTVDNNTSDPDTGGANWTVVQANAIQKQAGNWAPTDTGSANAVVTAFNPPFLSLAAMTGVTVRIRKGALSNGGPVTLAVDGLAPTPIIHANGSPLIKDELPTGGIFEVTFDGINFQLTGGNMSGAGLGNPVNVQVAVAVTVGQSLLLGPDGLAYPAQVTDYAAVNAANAPTMVQGATASAASDWAGPNRIPIPIGNDVFFYQVVGVAGPLIYRRDPDGVQQGAAVQIANSTCDNLRMVKLSNGNFVVVWGDGTNVRFAIVTPTLATVTAATTIETIYVGAQQYLDVIALSGGGFAVCYQQGSSNVLQRLAVYTNTGAVTAAPATIKTWVGTAGACMCRLIQISSGNIAIAMVSGFSTSTGAYYAIYTAAGVSVLATAQIIATCRAPAWIEVSQLAGFFAISINDGTSPFVQWAWVYNNAGALQGGAFNGTTSNINTTLPAFVLKNDGTSFYLLWHDASNWYLTTVPSSGTGYVTRNLTGSISGFLSASAPYADMFIARGIATPAFPTTNQFISFRISDLFVLQGLTTIGAPVTPDGLWQSIVDAGDFSYLSFWGQGGSPYTQAYYGAKFAASVILGSAGSTVSANQLSSVYVGAGNFAQTPEIPGSPSVHFDHTGATSPGRGNKGVIFNGGLALNGIV